jgi:chromatin remodeling complex protein RSC6
MSSVKSVKKVASVKSVKPVKKAASVKKVKPVKKAASVDPIENVVDQQAVESEESLVPAPLVDETVNEKKKDKKQRTRRVVTKLSLEHDFSALQIRIEEEIEKLRQSTEKVKGVKFLRSVNKAVKILKSDSVRVLKIKPKTNRPRSATSGFMKPVRISDEMSAFTEWSDDQLYSRVDVTKFICKYIRENKLQNQSDRRQIVCDDKLKVLLKYDPETAPEPLTYFRLQQYIQRHFIKETPPPPVVVVVAPPVTE